MLSPFLTKSKTSLSLSRLALLALSLPVAGFCTAIQIAGTSGGTTVCVLGTRPDPNATSTAVGVSPAGASTSGTLNYTYQFADGDDYSIKGIYSASYSTVTGLKVEFSPIITYTGNNGNTSAASAGADILTLNLFQNFYDSNPGVWSSPPPYCEQFGATIATGNTASGDLMFDGQGIGVLSQGPGTKSQTACAGLQFTAAQDASSYLNGDFDEVFTFAKSTAAGTVTSVTPTPEPTTLGLGLLGSGLFRSGCPSPQSDQQVNRYNKRKEKL